MIDCRLGSIVKVHSTFKVRSPQYIILFAIVKGQSVYIVSDDGREQLFEEIGLCSAYCKKQAFDVKITCIEVVRQTYPKTVVLGTENGMLLELVEMQLTRSIYASSVGSPVSCLKYSASHDIMIAGLRASQAVIFVQFSSSSDGFLTDGIATGPVAGIEIIETTHVSLMLFREEPASLSLVQLPNQNEDNDPIEVQRITLPEPEAGLLQ